MTSSITPITSASSNGADTSTAGERKAPEHGLAVLRDREAKALIHLSTDALSEAFHVGHDLHSAIYDDKSVSNAALQQTLAEVLTCMERAEHYLLMLGSNFEEENPPPDEEEPPW